MGFLRYRGLIKTVLWGLAGDFCGALLGFCLSAKRIEACSDLVSPLSLTDRVAEVRI